MTYSSSVDLSNCCKSVKARNNNIIVRSTLYVINRLCVAGYLKPTLFCNKVKDKKLLCRSWSSTRSYYKELMKDKTDSKAFNVIVKALYSSVTRMAHYIYVMNGSD